MKVYNASEIRNVAVLGHSGVGKTSILESALSVAGLINRIGKVEEGNTVSDFDQEEIKRKVSISASLIPIEWKENKINFIDTPGYFDFVGEVKQALSAADLGLIIVDAKSGVQVGTEKAWQYCTELGIPKFIFVNGMDDENADLGDVITQLREKFGKSIAPLQVPYIQDGKFVGFINALKKEGREYINGRTEDCAVPDFLKDAVDNAHEQIVEAVAETSDENMEKFFAEEEFSVEELQQGLRVGLTDGSLTPVICGCATKNIGVRVLLNSLITFVPSAAVFKPEVKATSVKTGEEVTLKCDNNESLAALVFKTIADPYVGRVTLFKVLSGVLKKDSLIYNPRTDSAEKVGALSLMRGKDLIPVTEICAGDIGAVSKMSSILTGDTLCTKEKPVKLPEIVYPNGYLRYAVFPKGKGAEDKVANAFSKILEEDRVLKFAPDSSTKETVLCAMGDNHVDVIVSKLKNKYNLEVELKLPRIPYREFIKGNADIRNKYKKQSGGSGQYGDVQIKYEPSGDLTLPYVFEEKIFGGSVPKQYFPAVEKGIEESVQAGPLAGYPVVGIKCTLVDGSYHNVDSNELSFKIASTQAFKEGFMKSNPGLLEPIYKIDITVPDDYTGDVMSDMNKRRGRVLGMERVGDNQVIQGEAPLSELFKYSTDLRSMTQGRGSFEMEFTRYEEVTRDVLEKVVAESKKES